MAFALRLCARANKLPLANGQRALLLAALLRAERTGNGLTLDLCLLARARSERVPGGPTGWLAGRGALDGAGAHFTYRAAHICVPRIRPVHSSVSVNTTLLHAAGAYLASSLAR